MSHYRVNPIKEGDGVEVINCGSGNEYVYYGAMVISPISEGKCTIRFTHLTEEDDENKPLVEDVPVAMLRPVPEAIPQWEYRIGEITDGWYNNGWWLGRVVEKVHGTLTQYVIRFEDRSQHAFAFQDVRLHQEWSRGVWMYAKLSADC